MTTAEIYAAIGRRAAKSRDFTRLGAAIEWIKELTDAQVQEVPEHEPDPA